MPMWLWKVLHETIVNSQKCIRMISKWIPLSEIYVPLFMPHPERTTSSQAQKEVEQLVENLQEISMPDNPIYVLQASYRSFVLHAAQVSIKWQ